MTATPVQPQPVEFVRAISRLDATALVVGSMIGSGIFIVSADILRQVHAPGLLLFVWVLSGLVTLLGALSYGELAAMYPKAGGNYIYLREAISPLFGYLYGWTLFVVIQTGTIAAVAVAFARFTSVLWPGLSPDVLPGLGTTLHLPQPIGDIAVGISPQRIFAIASIVLLTWINVRGVRPAAPSRWRSYRWSVRPWSVRCSRWTRGITSVLRPASSRIPRRTCRSRWVPVS